MKKTVITLTIIAAIVLSLGGCGKARTAESKAPAAATQVTADVPAPAVEDAQPPAENDVQAAPSGAAEVDGSRRQNGERFETVIILEGMEEPVRYEHVLSDTVGFEMDYDYESFVRHSESDRECFVSIYDDAGNPENYLEVRYSPSDAETVADAIGGMLSNEYEISRDDSFMLEGAGSCIRIDASAEKGGMRMPDLLQMVYIIPAADGCRVATAHYAIEASEGFGRRFRYMMDTFSAIDSNGERRISDEQAVTAIRNYCCIQNPDLQELVNDGDCPAYWDVSSSDGQQIVVVFRSYTGAVNRYYIDPVSGETYVTEFVSGIMDDEQQTDERLNAWDYLAG